MRQHHSTARIEGVQWSGSPGRDEWRVISKTTAAGNIADKVEEKQAGAPFSLHIHTGTADVAHKVWSCCCCWLVNCCGAWDIHLRYKRRLQICNLSSGGQTRSLFLILCVHQRREKWPLVSHNFHPLLYKCALLLSLGALWANERRFFCKLPHHQRVHFCCCARLGQKLLIR